MNTDQLRAEFEAALDGLRFDMADDGTYTSSVTRVALEAYQAGRAALQSQPSHAGWKEAAIAWEVCASLHMEFCKGRDPLFKVRQSDFVKHAEDARARALETEALQSQDAEDAERLEWLLRHLPGDAIRHCVGVIADTADIDEFRAVIDHARRIEGDGE